MNFAGCFLYFFANFHYIAKFFKLCIFYILAFLTPFQ